MGCIRLEHISESCTSLGTHLRLIKGNTYTSQKVQGLTEFQSITDSQSYRYGYQGSEKDDVIKGKGNSYTTHFRQLDPRVGRWLSIDPKATAFESPYVSMGNRPIVGNDQLGDTLRLAYDVSKKNTWSLYQQYVNSELEGQFNLVYTQVKDAEGYVWQVSLETLKGGSREKLSEKGKMFYDHLNKVVTAKEIVRQKIVYQDSRTTVGSFLLSTLDLADIEQFDAAGSGGASSAGAFIHETIEQWEKAKRGLLPGEWSKVAPESGAAPEYIDSHNIGINAENKVNGNTRINDTDFKESDGTTTRQTINLDSSKKLIVTKTKIP